MPKLTKRLVESATCEGKDVMLHDSEVRGFCCKVTPRGKRVYMLYYRTLEGRQRKPVIGEHGALTCEQAREIAKDWMVEVRQGGDPSQRKQEARKALNLSEFRDIYEERHIDKMKPKSKVEEKRIWDKYIIPALGRNKLASLTRQDVVRLHHGLSEKPYMANRVLEALRRALNLAAEWGFIEGKENPCIHVKKYKEQSRERFLSSAELGYLGDALRAAEAESVEMKSATRAIRLLIFTGCRRNEILEMKHDWIDAAQSKVDFPDSKTGKKSVFLNPPALEILSEAERVKGNPYVCPGKGGKGHLVNLQKPWSRIRRRAEIFRLIDLIAEHEGWNAAKVTKARKESASGNVGDTLQSYRAMCRVLGIHLEGKGIEEVRLHDLRHSFASVGAASGFSLPMIGALLGHKEQSTTQRYAHLMGDPVKEAAGVIGSRIAAALEGRKAEVIEIRKK